jgi:hypothetical protein
VTKEIVVVPEPGVTPTSGVGTEPVVGTVKVIEGRVNVEVETVNVAVGPAIIRLAPPAVGPFGTYVQATYCDPGGVKSAL